MARNNETPIRVGLLGAGTVGSQTARLIVEQKDELSARIGRPIELTGVACLDPKETEKFPWIDQSIVTTDTLSVATNSDIVIELIGGTTVARKFVLAAIESGASVVTANKALLAKYGPEIYSAAEAKGVDIYFEAAVGGAIPFLRPLRESLVGDKVTSMLGIVNGTTNYILDEMTTKGLQFDDVLKDAQAKGYAEADPTGDIEGYDAANKAAIMATAESCMAELNTTATAETASNSALYTAAMTYVPQAMAAMGSSLDASQAVYYAASQLYTPDDLSSYGSDEYNNLTDPLDEAGLNHWTTINLGTTILVARKIDPFKTYTVDELNSMYDLLSSMKSTDIQSELYAAGAALEHNLNSSALNTYSASKIKKNV